MKKGVIHYAILGVLSLFFTGCQTEEPILPMDRPDMCTNPYRIDLADALDNANAIFAQIDENNTRAVSRDVYNVSVFTSKLSPTRSKSDTLLYVVNFDNDRGFAILGADSRVNSVYAISATGNININDTVDNKPFAMCIKYIEGNAMAKANSFGVTRTDEPIIPDFGDRKITYLKNIRPMLAEYPSRWHQWRNLNWYCGGAFNTQFGYSLGCGPLACAQIMSYYRWPEIFKHRNNEYSIDWDETNNYDFTVDNDGMISCSDVLAHFMHYVGLTIKAQYNWDNDGNTRVRLADLQNNFYKFGYENISSSKSLTHASVSTDIENGPILVYGGAVSGTNEHTWVIDGYLSYMEEWDAISNPDNILFYNFYHCVWGWGGANNGYFLWEDGNAINTTPFMYDDIDAGYNNALQYYKNLIYFGDFKPSR